MAAFQYDWDQSKVRRVRNWTAVCRHTNRIHLHNADGCIECKDKTKVLNHDPAVFLTCDICRDAICAVCGRCMNALCHPPTCYCHDFGDTLPG
jgi:hypothetical protein